MDPKTILFVGPQGSGKGTQVKLLTKTLAEADPNTSIMDVETGRLFRALGETGNATATRVKETIEAGHPVPDFVTNSFVMADFRDRFSPEMHITLDGFPRNADQAAFLDEMFAFYGRSNMTVVYLDTPEDIVKARMLARGRVDDTEEGIAERLRWSMAMMKDLLSYYESRPDTEFVTVNGAESVETVEAAIKTGLKL